MADQPTAVSLLHEAMDLRAAGESERAVERALRAREVLASDASPILRGQIELTLGNALADRGEHGRAEAALEAAGRAFLSAGRRSEHAQAQISRGRVLAERGLTDAAIAFFSELQAMKLPTPLRSQVLNNLGVLNRQIGNLSEAIDYLAQDADLCGKAGDDYGAAVAHYNLAGALAAADRSQQASSSAETASKLFESAGRRDLAEDAAAYARAITTLPPSEGKRRLEGSS